MPSTPSPTHPTETSEPTRPLPQVNRYDRPNRIRITRQIDGLTVHGEAMHIVASDVDRGWRHGWHFRIHSDDGQLSGAAGPDAMGSPIHDPLSVLGDMIDSAIEDLRGEATQ